MIWGGEDGVDIECTGRDLEVELYHSHAHFQLQFHLEAPVFQLNPTRSLENPPPQNPSSTLPRVPQSDRLHRSSSKRTRTTIEPDLWSIDGVDEVAIPTITPMTQKGEKKKKEEPGGVMSSGAGQGDAKDGGGLGLRVSFSFVEPDVIHLI